MWAPVLEKPEHLVALHRHRAIELDWEGKTDKKKMEKEEEE